MRGWHSSLETAKGSSRRKFDSTLQEDKRKKIEEKRSKGISRSRKRRITLKTRFNYASAKVLDKSCTNVQPKIGIKILRGRRFFKLPCIQMMKEMKIV